MKVVAPWRRHLTLALCTALHAFTHIYGTLLVPLYLLMRDDLHLAGVWQATLLVAVYGMVACLCSYPAGVLADRLDRKWLLAAGLAANALAFVGIGLSRDYTTLLFLSAAGGVASAIFHPAANALAPAHYPRQPGMAIGILGAGAGLGFFLGPQYAGWRAHGGWASGLLADWQVPCVEMGVIGVAFAALFALLAAEAPHDAGGREHPPVGRGLRWRIAAIALVLGGRDMAGVAMMTLCSVYLQKALHMDVRQAGLFLGSMMLIGVVANPLAVWLTPGRKRLPGLVLMLLGGGLLAVLPPHMPRELVLTTFIGFAGLQLGCYAVSDAAILERVESRRRGRVMGLFLSIAGTMASVGPWLMGAWTDWLGEAADHPAAYTWPFATLGIAMALASFSAPLIGRLGPRQGPAVRPVDRIDPETLEPAG